MEKTKNSGHPQIVTKVAGFLSADIKVSTKRFWKKESKIGDAHWNTGNGFKEKITKRLTTDKN